MEPKIRFKGFQGEWKETKFDSLAKIRRGLTYSPSNITAKGVRVLRSSNINEDTFITSEEDVFVKEGCVNIPLANDGDILITAANGSPRLVGKHTVIETNGSKMVPGGFMVLAMTDEPYFLNTCMSSPWYKKFLKTGVAGGNGAIGNLNKTALNESMFYIPTDKVERDSLGSYFQHLDSLIQSTTKKIESLKQVKAASLQSMFPQDGETTPRVRFKGFEGEWEVVTLGEVGTFKSNGVDKLINPNEKIINLLNYLDVYNSRQVTKDNCNSLMQVSASDRQIKECDIQKNDVFFTPSSETAEDIGYVLVMRDTLPNTCYSYHLMRYRPNEGVFFEDFPNCGFATKFVRTQMRLLAKGVQRFVIGKTEFESIKVQIPSYKEQMQIAEFFRSLDSQITLQTQRLEKLKQIKSACLDKMFV